MDDLAGQIFEAAQTVEMRCQLLRKIVQSQLEGDKSIEEELKEVVIPNIRDAAKWAQHLHPCRVGNLAGLP